MSASVLQSELCSESRARSVEGTELAFLIICTILVALRLVVRSTILNKLWWDDLLVVLSVVGAPDYPIQLLRLYTDGCWCQVFIAITFGLDMGEIANGLGRHIVCLSPAQLSRSLEFLYISEPILILSAMFSRLSFTLLMMRVFATTKKRRILLWAIFGLVLATNIAAAIAVLPQCDPVPKIWDSTIPGSCWNSSTIISVNYFNGGKPLFLNTSVETLLIVIF